MFHTVKVLDGGLASTLQMMGYEVDGDPLWSARLLSTNPEALYEVHSAFLNAGADIIITATYQASIEGFRSHLNIPKEESIKLFEKSVHLAKKARDSIIKKDPTREILIAGSVGPYGACQADGSEYTGSYISSVSEQELQDWHQPRIEALVASGVDFIAIETIPALAEALILLRFLKKYPDVRCWVSFSCKDEKTTNYGDDFGMCVRMCLSENPDQLIAVGINCTPPSFITPLLLEAEKCVPGSTLARVIYPNSGEMWTQDKKWAGSNLFMETIKAELETWMKLGVKVIGGCCRVPPTSIQFLTAALKNL